MAELVDALGSGPSGVKPVQVRVLFRASFWKAKLSKICNLAFFVRTPVLIDDYPIMLFFNSMKDLVLSLPRERLETIFPFLISNRKRLSPDATKTIFISTQIPSALPCLTFSFSGISKTEKPISKSLLAEATNY